MKDLQTKTFVGVGLLSFLIMPFTENMLYVFIPIFVMFGMWLSELLRSYDDYMNGKDEDNNGRN